VPPPIPSACFSQVAREAVANAARVIVFHLIRAGSSAVKRVSAVIVCGAAVKHFSTVILEAAGKLVATVVLCGAAVKLVTAVVHCGPRLNW
jgi:hypothetical protein